MVDAGSCCHYTSKNCRARTLQELWSLLEMGLGYSFFCMSLKGMNIGQHGTTDILAYFSQNRTEINYATKKLFFKHRVKEKCCSQQRAAPDH